MIATAIEVTTRHALVELRPCWLARLFGARTVRIELSWAGNPRGRGTWRAVNTGIDLYELPYREEIERALDFRPVGELPAATAREVRT
jgi:hypothetical protein